VPDQKRNDIWSIHCISVLSKYPKDVVAEEMIKAALEVMKKDGAKIIESYPPPTLPSGNTFSGTIPVFERQGFQVSEEVSHFYTRMVMTIEASL